MENKKRKWPGLCIWAVFCFSVIFFSFRFYYRMTDDFRIVHMTCEIPYNPNWEIEPLAGFEREELMKIFSRPFYYLGKGAQSYAFISEDKTYVLKFFKFKHLKPNLLMKCLPDFDFFTAYKKKKRERKSRLISSVFEGYKLAYDVHRPESALVFIHLNKTSDLQKKATLYDKIGRKFKIDLDQTVFVLQKSVTTTREVLKSALEKGDLDLAAVHLEKILNLYFLEYSKGIYDRDHGFMHNTGFLGDQAIHLDVGKLSKNAKMRQKKWAEKDLAKLEDRMLAWLEAEFPRYRGQMMDFWKKRIEEKNIEKAALVGSRS